MNDLSFDLDSLDLLENLHNLSFNTNDAFEEHQLEELISPRRRGATSAGPCLIRTDSITGRPEEFFQTIKKKNPRGVSIQVGDYQLGEKLGKGAFGVVYKGLDTKTGQFVAVKRMSREKIDSDSITKEITFLQTFNHVNIVSYKGLIRTENHLNLILEYVDSGSLAQVLAGYGFFPESLAAIYTSQVLDGLAYLHSQGVVHRDIKGGNILLSNSGTVKLADFGIATSVNSGDHNSLVDGSPYWMAPEIIEMGAPTTASDIWSLACTLIELLTGVPPYFEMSPVSAVYRMVKDEHPPLPDDLSPQCQKFLAACFQRDPSNRPTATQLRNYPWILEHVKPSQNITVEDMRNTIKRYTIGRENNYSSLASINWEDPVEHNNKRLSASQSTPIKLEKKKKIKLKEMVSESSFDQHMENISDESISDGSTSIGRKKKIGSIFKLSKKKDKKHKRTTSTDFTSDVALFLINVYGFETKRSIFTYTTYKIKIMVGIEQWEIERTWSEFKDFHDKLKKEFPALDLPDCPPRKFWGVMETEFIKGRMQDLQIYCNSLLKVRAVRESPLFKDFFKR